MCSIKLGPEYLTQCRSYGLSSYAAVALGRIGHCTIGTAMGSVAIETNLRATGCIRTHHDWSGCVTITSRGERILDVLGAAAELDTLIVDPYSTRRDVSEAAQRLTEARNTVAENPARQGSNR